MATIWTAFYRYRKPFQWLHTIGKREARFKVPLMQPTGFAYAERHDNIEAIYKKLTERRDTANVTALLKELHRIVNEAIRKMR